MKIGITGESGFIGNAVKKAILKEGHNVVSLDRYTDYAVFYKKTIRRVSGNLQWVLHFAAKTSIEDSFKNPFLTYTNNFTSTLSALEIARVHKTAFLYMSSYVYGTPCYLPVDEKHPINATNPYMGSKIIGEELCRQWCNFHGMPLIILRGFTIYGDCNVEGRLIPDLVKSMRKGTALVVKDPVPKRDHLYLKDFLSLILKIISQRKVAVGTYNVGFGKSYSNREVAELIVKLSGRNKKIIIKSSSRPNDIQDCVADIRLVSKTFSWVPHYTLERGLKELLS